MTTQKKPVVLVVDDDEEIGFMLQMMLNHKGFSVILLKRAEQTEEVLSKNQVDVIILDMLIAGVKGTDVCIRLKNNPVFAHIPIIMITALPDAKTICAQAGANDFLSKPFEMDDMISKLHSLIKNQ
jgi:DNA-binding response OmpR family regulator